MASAPWHPFEPGEVYELGEIAAVLREHITHGGVRSPDEKLDHLRALESSGATHLRFDPHGSGWGRSPLNPSCWTDCGEREPEALASRRHREGLDGTEYLPAPRPGALPAMKRRHNT